MTIRSADLDATLHTLDTAAPVTEAQHRQAGAVLERILATPPGPPPRNHRRRLVLVTAAVAVAAMGAFAGALAVLPGVDGEAYASWTPVPTRLTDAEVALIGGECRRQLDRGTQSLDRARLVLSERRGEYAMLLYRVENPETAASCLVHNIPGSDDVDRVKSGATGSSGPAMTVTGGEFTQGGISDYRKAAVTDGAVGEDVAGITIRAGDLTVQASIANGRYAAWWPGPAFAPFDGTGEAELLLEYDVTLRDGTVITGAQPAPPR